MSKEIIPQKLKTCQVEGCTRKCRCKNLCARHYKQMQSKGYVYGNPKKLIYGEYNRVMFDGDICKIELYDVEGNVKAFAIIDSEDYQKVKNFKWSMDGRGYVVYGRRDGINTKLHQLVLGTKGGDHKDGDPLNNKKQNLRECTSQQNSCNCNLSKNNTSGFNGVSWDKRRGKWLAQLKFKYKQKHLGRFIEKIDAAKAYNEGALKYFGEFARFNEV